MTASASECGILGQRKAVGHLQAALRRGAPPAWIFHGPFGVGKATAALRFARLLIDPATDDAAIARFEGPPSSADAPLFEAGHPDIHVITRELARFSVLRTLRTRKLTNIPVDLIREHIIGGRLEPSGARILVDPPAYRTSVRGGGKVFIVDEAELLQDEAQNALLKTLEEPPPRTWLIFLTTRIGDLRPTVRSRCQVATFAPLDRDSMRRWLPQSGLALEAAEESWALRLAAGSPGAVAFVARHGLLAWRTPVARAVNDLISARSDPGMVAIFITMIDALTESILEERRNASPNPHGAARSPAAERPLKGRAAEADEADEEPEGDEAEAADAASTGRGAARGEASKVAARRDSVEWLLAALVDEAAERARRAALAGADPEPALRLIDLASQAIPMLDANLNLKSVLADLAALGATPTIATVPFTGRAR
ncbi:MAG TPA: hypothetical protein PKC43_08865 [Phycisphaerales bacterium]|nr:hypothetical protein [Phycisphaerales bacterium]HMP37547.1 hypothetical protein [Phycisphaerales bacterium]